MKHRNKICNFHGSESYVLVRTPVISEKFRRNATTPSSGSKFSHTTWWYKEEYSRRRRTKDFAFLIRNLVWGMRCTARENSVWLDSCGGGGEETVNGEWTHGKMVIKYAVARWRQQYISRRNHWLNICGVIARFRLVGDDYYLVKTEDKLSFRGICVFFWHELSSGYTSVEMKQKLSHLNVPELTYLLTSTLVLGTAGSCNACVRTVVSEVDIETTDSEITLERRVSGAVRKCCLWVGPLDCYW